MRIKSMNSSLKMKRKVIQIEENNCKFANFKNVIITGPLFLN